MFCKAVINNTEDSIQEKCTCLFELRYISIYFYFEEGCEARNFDFVNGSLSLKSYVTFTSLSSFENILLSKEIAEIIHGSLLTFIYRF